jgi:hypothetical protein
MKISKLLILCIVFGLFFVPTLVLAAVSAPQAAAPVIPKGQMATASPPSLRHSAPLAATLPFYIPLAYKPTDAPVWTPTATASGSGASDVDVIIVNIYWSGTASKNESDEYLELFNSGSTPFDLGGWSVYAEDTFAEAFFPQGFSLAPGKFCRVYTNEIHEDSCGGVSFGSAQEVWPNDYSCGGLYTPIPEEENAAYYCY